MTGSHRSRLAILALGFLLFSASIPLKLAAQDDCYCIEHVATGQLYRGCSLFQGPNDVFATAIDCRSGGIGEEAGLAMEIVVNLDWRAIPEGEDKCGVCRPDSRQTKTVPRGP